MYSVKFVLFFRTIRKRLKSCFLLFFLQTDEVDLFAIVATSVVLGLMTLITIVGESKNGRGVVLAAAHVDFLEMQKRAL